MGKLLTLKEWMSNHGVSDGEMAKMIGRSISAVRAYKSGARKPNSITLSKIMVVTGYAVSLTSLLGINEG